MWVFLQNVVELNDSLLFRSFYIFIFFKDPIVINIQCKEKKTNCKYNI